MRCRIMDTTWLWNTGQSKRLISSLFLLLLHISLICARPDFIDSMSRQFFGLSGNNDQSPQQQYQQTPDPFAQMFGSASAQTPQRPPPQAYQRTHPQQRHPPQRQGYFAPPPHHVQHQHPHHVQHQQQLHPPYNGPPPVYGQQQGFGQREPNSNETKTVGYPPDNQKHNFVHPAHPHHQDPRHYPPVEYHQQAEVVDYSPQHHAHAPHQYEYQHIPPQAVEVAHHEGPSIEIHTGKEHAYHVPPAHAEYHHPPHVEYHHHTPHKPKRFQLSYNEPSPEYKIVDKHIKLPPVKFRFHINPKIVITSNTKDPLDKKHHDDEHDLEPFPPPDTFSDPNAPPSYNEHKVEYYPQKHHYPIVEHHAVDHVVGYPQAKHPYPVEHHAVEHVVGYPQAKHPYPVEHHAVEHHPAHEYTYDLSRGHSHLNPHRSLGHYEPMFKVKTKPIIFTEPPPTRRTTTTTTARPTTSTARTTTTRTTTTARPTRRARISARNPGFSVAFTEGSTAATTQASTTSSTTTRRSIFRSSSERERENGGISERKDELSTSAETSSSTQTTTTTTSTPSTTTTTTTTPKPSTTTTTLAPYSSSTTTTTTPKPDTTTTTEKPTTVTTTTTTARTTTQNPTTPSSTTTTTTQKPTTLSTTTTTILKLHTPSTITTTTTPPTSRPTPAEETTPRSTTLSADANEIDMRRVTEPPRRRPEPLQDESSSVERSGSFNFESSESVKVIETNMLIDGKNQTVRFYYITEPVKLPLDVFQKMTGQKSASGVNVIKIRDKRFALADSESDQDIETLTGL